MKGRESLVRPTVEPCWRDTFHLDLARCLIAPARLFSIDPPSRLMYRDAAGSAKTPFRLTNLTIPLANISPD
jgi:hypothetical protein